MGVGAQRLHLPGEYCSRVRHDPSATAGTSGGSAPAHARTLVHHGRKFDLEAVTIPGPGGTPLSRDVVRHPGAVVILPILDGPPRAGDWAPGAGEGPAADPNLSGSPGGGGPQSHSIAIGDSKHVVLIRNFRVSVERELIELPAGTLEPMEKPEDCAARELVEETGYEAATIQPLGRFYTTPGVTDELMWAFAATGLRHVGQRLQPDERLTVYPVPAPEALAMIDRAQIADGKTIATLLLAARKGLL